MLRLSFLLAVPLTFHLVAARAHAQVLVQPWTYHSRSRTVDLFVDPTERNGSGPGRYRLSRGATISWQGELPFTFADALVHDDGSVAGFAYTLGMGKEGELVIAILAPDGTMRAEHRLPRKWSRIEHGPIWPFVSGLRTGADRLAFELNGVPARTWWVYRWSGERVGQGSDAPEGTEPPDAPQLPREPPTPDLDLRPLGRVSFPWPVPTDDALNPRSEHRPRIPHRVHVDRAGRVWISELSTRIVHVFEASGAVLGERAPDPRTFRPYRPCDWIASRDDGSLVVSADGSLERFAPDGARISHTKLDAYLPPRWLFLPSDLGYWSLDFGRIDRVTTDGAIIRSVERGANGQWLQDQRSASVAADGALAVLDDLVLLDRGRSALSIHLFSIDGAPRVALPVPSAFADASLAYDGRFLVLLQGRELLVLNDAGAPVGRTSLGEEVVRPYHVFFSPDGELWIFPYFRAEMFRFALPR